MSETDLLWTLGVALAASKLLGHGFDRAKLPPILGQILVGLVLVHVPGPFRHALRGEVFGALGDLGLVMLLMMTGTESRLADIKRAGLPATLVAIGGVAGPFLVGLAAALALGFALPQALVTGALFTPTSIGITAVTLLELHRLRTLVGATLVGAAILDDVIALGLVAVVLNTGGPLALLAKTAVFFAAAAFFGWKLMPRFYRVFRKVHLPEAPLSYVLVVTFVLAAFAESLGLAAITGAFLAGLAVREKIGEERLLDKVHGVSFGLLIPLFFIHLGAALDLGQMGAVGRYAPLLLAASFGGKFLGAAAGGLLARLSWARTIQVGVGMLPRLEVSLVVVALAVRQGIFQGALADVMAGVALLNMAVSLLITPTLMRATFRLEPDIEAHHPPVPPTVDPESS